MKKIIVITGNLGSGKSLAAKILRRKFPCIDADTIVAWTLKRKKEVLRKIIPSAFIGRRVFKKKIAETIFSNPSLRRRWERVIHDFVFLEFENWFRNQKGPCIFIAPLYFEAKRFSARLKSLKVPKFVVLIASLRIRCLQVAKKKWGLSGAARLGLQILPELASLKGDIVLGNLGSLTEFKKNVMILRELIDVL